MSIIRIKHNKENPYVMLNKAAVWDKNLSLKAIGLWARCMSRPDDWIFKVSELSTKGKEGKTTLYNCIDELIENGYALRIQVREEDKSGKYLFTKVEYVFFEFKLTDQEKEDFLNEFKKCFPHSGFPHAETPHPENETLLSIKERQSNEREQISSNPKVPTPESLELVNLFLENILQENPGFKKPANQNAWAKEFDAILRIDKRNLEEIKKIIEWCTHDLFWKSNILSPIKLRQKFDQLKLKMQSTPKTYEKKLRKQDVLKELEKRFPKAIEKNFLVVGSDYVEFKKLNWCCHIKLEENGFFDQLESNLKKVNAHTSWLKDFR